METVKEVMTFCFKDGESLDIEDVLVINKIKELIGKEGFEFSGCIEIEFFGATYYIPASGLSHIMIRRLFV